MIASRARDVYLRVMTATHLIRLLTIFALLLAPPSIVGEHAAMARPAAPAASAHHAGESDQAGHCAEMSGPLEDEKAPATDCLIDCVIACSTIPAVASQMADQPPPVGLVQPMPLAGRISGLNPEWDPPPPRIA